MHHKTTTVLTIDLPDELGDRLRKVVRKHPDYNLRDVAVAALEEWLDHHAARLLEVDTKEVRVPGGDPDVGED